LADKKRALHARSAPLAFAPTAVAFAIEILGRARLQSQP